MIIVYSRLNNLKVYYQILTQNCMSIHVIYTLLSMAQVWLILTKVTAVYVETLSIFQWKFPSITNELLRADAAKARKCRIETGRSEKVRYPVVVQGGAGSCLLGALLAWSISCLEYCLIGALLAWSNACLEYCLLGALLAWSIACLEHCLKNCLQTCPKELPSDMPQWTAFRHAPKNCLQT